MKREWLSFGFDEALVERETMYCRRCFSSLRVRRIADVLIRHYAERAESAVDLVSEPGFRSLHIAEINSVGALHPVLQRHPQLYYSEFRENAEPGTLVAGARNEDVCSLTYEDASFDVVLTADTLEHVPDFRKALREIRRVLRRGGRHIFTVPVIPSRRATQTRVTVDDNGGLAFLAPPQYHGRGSGLLALVSPTRTDFLAYHDFGLDLVDQLREVGFRPETHFYRESGPASDAAVVFCGEAV
jgi:SAM-dependent methyltransferase